MLCVIHVFRLRRASELGEIASKEALELGHDDGDDDKGENDDGQNEN